MNRIATIFLAVTASLFFVGCYNDFDTPAPAKVWTDADFSDSKIISIKELKDIFEEAYPGTSGIGQSLTITDDLVIRGKVISSDQAGNVGILHYLCSRSPGLYPFAGSGAGKLPHDAQRGCRIDQF